MASMCDLMKIGIILSANFQDKFKFIKLSVVDC